MEEKREGRTKKIAEELSKLLQIHAHLAALEPMAAYYGESKQRLLIKCLELNKAHTVNEGDIVRASRVPRLRNAVKQEPASLCALWITKEQDSCNCSLASLCGALIRGGLSPPSDTHATGTQHTLQRS